MITVVGSRRSAPMVFQGLVSADCPEMHLRQRSSVLWRERSRLARDRAKVSRHCRDSKMSLGVDTLRLSCALVDALLVLSMVDGLSLVVRHMDRRSPESHLSAFLSSTCRLHFTNQNICESLGVPRVLGRGEEW
jgi:hypothetical protein